MRVFCLALLSLFTLAQAQDTLIEPEKPEVSIVDFDRSYMMPILKLFYDNWYWFFPEDDYSPEEILEYLTPEAALYIKVLLEDKEFAGFVVYYRKTLNEGRIQFSAVVPKFRRKGYGQLLHEYPIQELFKMGCTKVSMVSRAENTKIRKIYERIGCHQIHYPETNQLTCYETCKANSENNKSQQDNYLKHNPGYHKQHTGHRDRKRKIRKRPL